MVSQAKLKAQYKYDSKNTKQVILKLNKKNDSDILEKLENSENRQGYIKELIRRDLRAYGKILTLDSIKALVQPVAKKYDISKIFLFGSYARGEATEKSDVDLLIEGGNYEGLIGYIGLNNHFEHAIGKKIDLLTVSALEENKTESGIRFKKNIDSDKVIVYAK